MIKTFVFSLGAILFMACQQKTNTNNFVITDFGAKADGATINTKFINDAIVACHNNGGGTVIVPAGIFSTGTVELLSNVNLHLDAGAKLLGSQDTIDYKPMKKTLFNEGYNRYGLIYSADAINISITGTGEINGNGTFFMNGIDKPHMGRDWDRKYVRQGEAYMKVGDIFENGTISYKFRPGMMLTFERCQNCGFNVLITSLNGFVFDFYTNGSALIGLSFIETVNVSEQKSKLRRSDLINGASN